jgi:cell division septation protein DedD
MDEKQTSESAQSPGQWVGQLVAAVILAEGIWGLLASLTSNLLVPLLARVMEVDPQSPLYLGKGELNVPALFNSVLTLCLAGIVFVLLQEWSRRKRAPVRMKMVRVTKKVSQPTGAPLSIMNPAPVPEIPQAPLSASAMPEPQQSKPVSPPVVAPAKPAKPKSPKEVYYNIVGEPINPTEND